ncbi:contact-dependent growth inhibition system immunity protein [Mycolicibacterium houstonense]|uniref:contact-dependent growth inhibition system immunity protein n=1 Tax=Mycolicibacterium houstonense TaxID=146021 RepID=UPI003F9E266F
MNDGSISTSLYQFFAAYFHQDWDLEADDWEGIVDGYAADHPAAEPLQTLAQEIDGLRVARSEPDLEQFLVNTVGVYYGPEPLTYKEWLGQIADRLRGQAARIDSHRAECSQRDA